MAEPKFVVTGCGRSGTGSVAAALTAAGVQCGHEAVYDRSHRRDVGDLQGDASWFAVAHELPAGVDVIHLVRDPLSVARSFHRIGLFANTPLRAAFGQYRNPRRLVWDLRPPKKLLDRLPYVRGQRDLVRSLTGVFDAETEAQRCLRYWVEWNRLAERFDDGRRRYLRVRLEDDPWSLIGGFLGLDQLDARRENRKVDHAERPFDGEPDVALVSMAERYGYRL